MTQIKIEKFEKLLGENYLLVKTIWEKICKEEFSVQCFDPLGKNDVPIDECNEIEKILLTCIAYLEDGENKYALTNTFLLTVYANHKIDPTATIKVRGFFFIVIEQ
jgi:hypothetical protein